MGQPLSTSTSYGISNTDGMFDSHQKSKGTNGPKLSRTPLLLSRLVEYGEAPFVSFDFARFVSSSALSAVPIPGPSSSLGPPVLCPLPQSRTQAISAYRPRKRYAYCICSGVRKHGRDFCPCGSIRAEALEHFVLGELRKILSSSKALAEFKAGVRGLLDRQAQSRGEAPRLQRELEKLTAEKSRLFEQLPSLAWMTSSRRRSPNCASRSG